MLSTAVHVILSISANIRGQTDHYFLILQIHVDLIFHSLINYMIRSVCLLSYIYTHSICHSYTAPPYWDANKSTDLRCLSLRVHQ